MNNDLNEWIIGKLNKNSWSISELGRKTGINQSTLSKVLSGKRTPNLDFYVRVARSFGENTIPEMLFVAGLLPVRISEDKYTGLLWKIKQLSDEDKKVTAKFVDYLKYRQTVEKLTDKERTEFFKFADFLLLKRESIPE